jgi:hypothetical protein
MPWTSTRRRLPWLRTTPASTARTTACSWRRAAWEPPGRSVSNISAAVIVELAAALAGAMKPGGIGVAAGIVAEFEMQCVGALASAGARVAWTMQADEWRTLVFSRG